MSVVLIHDSRGPRPNNAESSPAVVLGMEVPHRHRHERASINRRRVVTISPPTCLRAHCLGHDRREVRSVHCGLPGDPYALAGNDVGR
jgi:hypothetical protein